MLRSGRPIMPGDPSIKAMQPVPLLYGCIEIGALLFLQAGCSHSELTHAVSARQPLNHRRISAGEAATLAARLANDECERLYKKRPFSMGQHAAVLDDEEYRWGGLDVGAPGGFSALVTFRADGSHPNVEVYYSSDLP